MKFGVAVDAYVRDMRNEGRMRPTTERAYRAALHAHAGDVADLDPAETTREHVMRTLERWPHPNSRRKNRAILSSFYAWAMHEGLRHDNPALQTRPPKQIAPSVYRLTREEAVRIFDACETTRERRAIGLGLAAGLRNREIRALCGVHLSLRPGFVWVSREIAKGGVERWVPVLPDLADVAAEIAATVADGEYIIATRRCADPGRNRMFVEDPLRPTCDKALINMVVAVGERAGIRARVHPHLLRHAFGDYIARHAGLRVAQAMLGHKSVETTESTYVGQVPLDEIVAATVGLTFRSAPAPDELAARRPMKGGA